MTGREVRKLVAIVLIIVEAFLVIRVLGFWLMHSMMMGGGIMDPMGGSIGWTSGPLLIAAAVLVLLAVVLLPKGGARNGEMK